MAGATRCPMPEETPVDSPVNSYERQPAATSMVEDFQDTPLDEVPEAAIRAALARTLPGEEEPVAAFQSSLL
ncbi:FXSXX-COOH protein [Streptomyces sp. B3I7]|nr:FXSXX-COOH protein [Streptomyces sp. B3I8]MDQ0809418.1 FXSXX-COOH protein [Streptomyces sp. B3I7]